MIYIVTGDIETGKSTALQQWLKGREDVYGILTLRNKKNKRYLLDVHSNTISPMQAEVNETGTISIGRYTFYKKAFEKANTILNNVCEAQDKGFIIIDELGKLELDEKGLHASALSVVKKTQHHQSLHSVLVIRTSLLDMIKKKYHIIESQIFNCKTIKMLEN